MKCLTHDEILQLEEFVPYPIIIYNDRNIAFRNRLFEELDLDENYIMKFAKVHPIKEFIRTDLIVFNKNKEKKAFEISSEPVSIDDDAFYLSYLVDITEKKKKDQKLRKMSITREGLLEIDKTILTYNSIQIILNNVLKNTLKAIDKADLGAVFIIDNEMFKLVTYVGFGKEIEDYSFPLQDAFLYIATDGNMNRIVTSSEKEKFGKSYPGKNFEGEQIQSTMTAPIYSHSSFLGIINIYSTSKDAFDKDDMKTMEFIRNNIEIAVANHLTAAEKDEEAENESMSKVYNWNFISNQYKKFKEKAIESNEKFFVVMIDVDRLKRTNDNFGSLAGDKVVNRISSELQKITTSSDILIRFESDEFIGIFSNTSKENLVRKFDGAKNNLKINPIFIETTMVIPSFTYGVSAFPDDGKVLEELVSAADERMNLKKVKQWKKSTLG